MNTDELKSTLKRQIVQYLNLLDVKPEDIKDDEPLFGGELGLDSIDSLELVVLLEREYGIKINNPTEGRKILVDVNHMANFIMAHKKADV
ncbi:MAG: phosphopantetheine-binding protein [Spirosomataceae bacterium]